MIDRCETFRDCSSFIIPKTSKSVYHFLVFMDLQNWMRKLCMFSQIQSHMCCNCVNIATASSKCWLLFVYGLLQYATLLLCVKNLMLLCIAVHPSVCSTSINRRSVIIQGLTYLGYYNIYIDLLS